MLLRLDMSSTVPIYLQLRNQIVLGIGSGKLQVGQGLPTVRQLAEDLGINAMTVTKAYTLLKNQGFIAIDRRHGAKVQLNKEKNSEFQRDLEDQLSLLIAESLARGMEPGKVMSLCQSIFAEMSSRGGKDNV